MKAANSDGRVDPAGETFQRLRLGIPAGLSEAKVQGIMPHAKPGDVTKYLAQLQPSMLDPTGSDTYTAVDERV